MYAFGREGWFLSVVQFLGPIAVACHGPSEVVSPCGITGRGGVVRQQLGWDLAEVAARLSS